MSLFRHILRLGAAGLLLGLAALAMGCGSAPEPEASAAPPDNLHIFVLAGQSNMSGRGSLNGLPRGFPRHGARLWMLANNDHWEPAHEPVDHCDGQVDRVSLDPDAGVGPGLSFADELAGMVPEINVGLVPCAKSSSSIDQWAPGGGADTLLGRCLERSALAARHGRVVGLIWYQGESDTYSPEAVRSWNEKFEHIVEVFRGRLASPGLAVLVVQIGPLAPRWQRDGRFAHWHGLQVCQAGLGKHGCRVVPSQDLALKPDGIHLTTAAQLMLGKRLARAFLGLPQPPLKIDSQNF